MSAHQGNDFQINNAFWAEINTVSEHFHVAGQFVTFPDYEWSGNTAVGGDHNVFYREPGRPIYRSSHALLTDRATIDDDAPTLANLYDKLQNEDCVVYAHVGGRYANLDHGHDSRHETAMEIHSAWGTFEWLLTDAFTHGYRPGVVCNSDGHKCRPGASYPGAAMFGAYGGLTCFLAPQLTRDAIMESQRSRHHYGTTGSRIHLDVKAAFRAGKVYHRDPRHVDVSGTNAVSAMMGDIVETHDKTIDLALTLAAPSPIERVDILNGSDDVQTLWGFEEQEIGARLRIMFSGAHYRRRGRQTRWSGTLKLNGNRITKITPIQVYNHDRPIILTQPDLVQWDVETSGNRLGFDAWLAADDQGTADIATNLVSGTSRIADIRRQPLVLDAGGLKRQISISRLPETAPNHRLTERVSVPLKPGQDNPIWVRVSTLDGHIAWSSPVYMVTA